MESKPFCKRCLLFETGEAELIKNISELIDSMPEELKSSEETYANRISACTDCGELYRGMCRACGCYVELRAAKAALNCPAVPPKW